MISEADFCDKFVQAIRLVDKVVEVDDGTMIQILCNDLRTRVTVEDTKIPYGHVVDDKAPSPLIRVSATIDIPTQNLVLVPVHAKLHGLVVIQPKPKLFDRHELISSNGIA